MFPPPADERCQIIQFVPKDQGEDGFYVRKKRAAFMARARELTDPNIKGLTETCRNKRLREQRKIKWRAAEVTRQYWRARMDWRDALTGLLDRLAS